MKNFYRFWDRCVDMIKMFGRIRMNNFTSEEYIDCKKWIAQKIQEGFSWDDVRNLCVSNDKIVAEFDRLQNDELLIPQNMNLSDWINLVNEHEKNCPQIQEMYGISDKGNSNSLPVPTDAGSPWLKYKRYLLGKIDGKRRMSDEAVDTLERNCHWILNHLKRDTRKVGTQKGLVMGSVQSGKTANMIGLVTMAAHYDWNFFIILSGTIENLRKQTRDRFKTDLLKSGGVSWHILDYTSNSNYLKDLNNVYTPNDLHLNSYQDGKQSNDWLHRYVTVCLKNSRRLTNLITWLHTNRALAARMRILVIDDEADQASVNTRKMGVYETDEDFIERTAVNQLIINLVNGNNADGSTTLTPFQAMNYISFTATPYANVLNEAYKTSLYPKDFICSLPESNEYFGAKVIFGSYSDDTYPGLDIVRTIPKTEMQELKKLHKGNAFTLPDQMKRSVCWFLCAAAVLRYKGHKKPISMLIHTTSLQRSHFEEYNVLRSWLTRESISGSIITLCENIYYEEKDKFTLDMLREGFSSYKNLNNVDGNFPSFDEIKQEIQNILSDITNIELGSDKKFGYKENAIHLCVDNCAAKRASEEGTYLRIVYPSDEQLSKMSKAPVFIVMGGNTLSRGLTIEGLVCTYFARNSMQADTLMQMARWFGYRKGYELLQRIWMPDAIQKKFSELERIDEKLKSEFEDFMEKGKSPSRFGPKVMTSLSVAKFIVTSKNKSQNAEPCDFDFSGDSYETTKFEDTEMLQQNIRNTDEFLMSCGTPELSQSKSAYIWRNIDSGKIITDFFGKYCISEYANEYTDIPIFINWLKKMNLEGHYNKWNVAVAGDNNAQKKWGIAGAVVGTINRSRKKKETDFIDIGSLRSGRDVICDVDINSLDEAQRNIYENAIKSGKDLIRVRGALNLSDTPLLLLYKINKDGGKDSALRSKINSQEDIIGFSVIIAGEPNGSSYITAITVRIPE